MDPSNETVATPESQTQPPVEQPTTDQVAETQPEATNVTDAPDETAATAEASTEGTQASAPETTPAPEEDLEDDFKPDFQNKVPEPVDPKGFIDEAGNFDLAGYTAANAQQTQATIQAAVDQARQERAYEKTWDKAYEAFPELRKDKNLRDMVQAIHANSPQTGKYISPKQAAEKLFGLRGQAKQEGIRAAQETRTVQAAANLGQATTAATTSTASSKVTELRNARNAAPTLKAREDANAALLAELVKSGAI